LLRLLNNRRSSASRTEPIPLRVEGVASSPMKPVPVSKNPNSHSVTGSKYNLQMIVHRAMMMRDYSKFRLHEGGFNPQSGLRQDFQTRSFFRSRLSLRLPLQHSCGLFHLGRADLTSSLFLLHIEDSLGYARRPSDDGPSAIPHRGFIR